jgi:hypothetical protein
MSTSCRLRFEDLKDCRPDSGALDINCQCRICGKLPAEHGVKANQLKTSSYRKCVFILFRFEGDIPHPQGTAFAIQSPSQNTLLTAAQNIIAEKSMTDINWHITASLDRDADGWIANSPFMHVVIKAIDMANGIAVLTLFQQNYQFPDSEVLHICPKEEVPNVIEEQEFKTYYCPISDLVQDVTYPSLSITASEWKRAYSIQKGNNGKMWLKGGLAHGASGGVVVNKQGQAVAIHLRSSLSVRPLKRFRKDSFNCSVGDDSSFEVETISDPSMSSPSCYTQICSILSFNMNAMSAFNINN